MSDYLNKKGKVITFNEIQKEAERTGQTTEALIKLFELVKAPEKPGKGLGTTVEDANVAPQVNQPANTGSASENTSSGFQNSNEISQIEVLREQGISMGKMTPPEERRKQEERKAALKAKNDYWTTAETRIWT